MKHGNKQLWVELLFLLHFVDDRVKLHAFEKFEDTAEALSAATALVEGKLDKDLKSFLKKWVTKKGINDGMGVFEDPIFSYLSGPVGILGVFEDPILSKLVAVLPFIS